MKRMAKWCAVVLCGVLAAGVVAGCNENGGGEGEKTVVKMMLPDNATYPFNNEWLSLQTIREKFPNIDLQIMSVPDSDYQQKRQMLLSTGEAPDIITHTWADQVSEFAISGTLTSITEHMDQLPNLKKRLDEWDLHDELKGWNEADGNLYVLPGLMKNLTQDLALGLRVDLFEKYNIPVPTTYDELYEGLVKLKEADPTLLGLTERDKTGGPLFSVVARSFDTNGGYSLPSGYTYNYDTEEWVFAPTTEEFRTMLRYFNKLYEAGVLDKEAFSQDNTLYDNKMRVQGTGVASVVWVSEDESINKALKEAGVENPNFQSQLPLAGPNGTRRTKSSSRITGGAVIPIQAERKDNFDEILGLVDWLYYSDEGIELVNFGVEGVTYTKTADGKYQMDPKIKTATNQDALEDIRKDYGVAINGLMLVKHPQYNQAYESERFVNFINEIESGPYVPLDDPILKFNEDEKTEEKVLVADLKGYFMEQMIKFIQGDRDLDTDWDAYVHECNNKGVQTLMEIVNTVWARQNANN